jgi:hypothetical protein
MFWIQELKGSSEGYIFDSNWEYFELFSFAE